MEVVDDPVEPFLKFVNLPVNVVIEARHRIEHVWRWVFGGLALSGQVEIIFD